MSGIELRPPPELEGAGLLGITGDGIPYGDITAAAGASGASLQTNFSFSRNQWSLTLVTTKKFERCWLEVQRRAPFMPTKKIRSMRI